MDKLPIIILGHSGFIGSHLESSLRMDGRNVIGKSLPEVDLSNPDEISKIEEYFTIDSTIIIVAAVKRQFGDSPDTFNMNLSIVKNICHVLIKRPVKRVLFFSSAAVYGEETNNLNISEHTLVNPTSYYGIAKYTSERLIEKAISTHSQPPFFISIRPPLIYGPGDQGKTYGPSGFSIALKEQTPITLWGDGTELREFLYIDDLCRIISVLIDSEFRGILNPVSGNSYTFSDIINILMKKLPSLHVTSRERSKQKADNAFDASLVKSIVGNEFKFTSLAQGIDLMLAHNK
jgi:nucleoside-diphosphate-sugar epimerase